MKFTEIIPGLLKGKTYKREIKVGPVHSQYSVWTVGFEPNPEIGYKALTFNKIRGKMTDDNRNCCMSEEDLTTDDWEEYVKTYDLDFADAMKLITASGNHTLECETGEYIISEAVNGERCVTVRDKEGEMQSCSSSAFDDTLTITMDVAWINKKWRVVDDRA